MSRGCSRIKKPSSFNIPAWSTMSGNSVSQCRSYGGSAKTMSYFVLHVLRYDRTSMCIVRMFSKPISFIIRLIPAKCFIFFSIRCTEAAPLEENSKLILPVPPNRSSTSASSKAIRFDRMLNNPSRAKSVVGLAFRSEGGTILLPLYFPPIIRN